MRRLHPPPKTRMPQRTAPSRPLSDPDSAGRLSLLKPPCPRCGARTPNIWTWLVGLAWLLFFPAGAALSLVRPTFRCWSCGSRFKGAQTVPVRASTSAGR